VAGGRRVFPPKNTRVGGGLYSCLGQQGMTILFSPSPVEVFLIPLQSKQIFHKVSARRRCSARYLCRVRNGRHVLHELLLIPSYEGKPWVVPGGNFYRRLHAPIVWNAHLVVVHAGRLRGMAVTGREGSSQW